MEVSLRRMEGSGSGDVSPSLSTVVVSCRGVALSWSLPALVLSVDWSYPAVLVLELPALVLSVGCGRILP